jgi:hypothetical protein
MAAYREKACQPTGLHEPNVFKNYTMSGPVEILFGPVRKNISVGSFQETPGPRKDTYSFCQTPFEPVVPPLPSGDAASQYALNGAAVELIYFPRTHPTSLQPPEGEEALSCPFHNGVCVCVRNLKLSTHSTTAPRCGWGSAHPFVSCSPRSAPLSC